MGRSLKEALLDQFALLQERGLAPSEVPHEDEAPMIVVESAPRGRAMRPRRESLDRFAEREDELALDVNGQFDKDRRRGARRELRGEDAQRERRRSRGGRGRGRPAGGEAELVVPATPGLAPHGDRPLGPRRPPMGGPMGLRRDRPGAPMGPRPGGPPPRAVGRTEMLQQRAEQRRRDQEDVSELRSLLGQVRGEEITDEAMETFARRMTEETGALPPPRVVVEAIKLCQSGDPRKIADAVRAYYRRPRPRPAGVGGPPPAPSTAPAPAPQP